MGLGSGAPHVPPGGVTVRPLMYAILLGTGVRVSMGQLGVTVCWADSLGGVATPPNSGLVLRGILLLVPFLIINFVRICVGFRSYGLVRYGPSGYEPGYT